MSEAEQSSHLEATTHTGEAPPAYHRAALYQTVTPETVTQSEDKTHKDGPSEAPPTYTEIAGRNTVHSKLQFDDGLD